MDEVEHGERASTAGFPPPVLPIPPEAAAEVVGVTDDPDVDDVDVAEVEDGRCC